MARTFHNHQKRDDDETISPDVDLMAITPHINVEYMVLQFLGMLGVDPNNACSHFSEMVNKMRACPPNYKGRTWIVRDYFPGTNFMFKVTMAYQSPEFQAKYRNRRYKDDMVWSAKDCDHMLYVNVKFIKDVTAKWEKKHVSYDSAQAYAKAKAANVIIGDDIVPEGFMPVWFKKMKRMFPKCYKPYKLPENRATEITLQSPKKKNK